MANFNKVILAGHLTKKPQHSYTQNQTAVAEFGIAVNRNWSDKQGNKKEEVCFIDCIAFAGQADTINKYLDKGSPILIDGRLKYDSWESDGQKRNRIRVIVEGFQFLGHAESKSDKPAERESEPVINDEDIPF